MVYVPGSQHTVSDALSRWAYPAGLDTQDATFHGDSKAQLYADHEDQMEKTLDFAISTIRGRKTAVCPSQGILQKKWKYSNTVWKQTRKMLLQHKNVDDFYLIKEKLYKNGKLCVPRDCQEGIILYYHRTGHPSAGKLFDKITHRHRFETGLTELRQHCQSTVKTCHICQAVKPTHQPYGILNHCPIPEIV